MGSESSQVSKRLVEAIDVDEVFNAIIIVATEHSQVDEGKDDATEIFSGVDVPGVQNGAGEKAVAEDGEIAEASAELTAVYVTHLRSGLNDFFLAVNRGTGVLEAFADEVVGLG